MFDQSSSAGDSQVSLQPKEIEWVGRVHEKGEVKKLDEVEEIDEYFVEEFETSGKKEEEVIEVESDEDSGSEEEEDWATQYTNSIRRFYKMKIDSKKIDCINKPDSLVRFHSLSPECRQAKQTVRQSRDKRVLAFCEHEITSIYCRATFFFFVLLTHTLHIQRSSY